MSRLERFGGGEKPRERPDFLVAYNAVEAPDTMVSQDAVDPQVNETVDTFFEAVYSSLDLSPRTLGHFFEREGKMLVPRYENDITSSERVYATDDYQERFRRRGHQILAAVTYIRDDFNYQIAHFSKFPLTPPTEKAIRDLQQMERIEFGLE